MASASKAGTKGTLPARQSGAGGGASAGATTPDTQVLVVVPTYNERENLVRLVPSILEQGEAFHVLVVDDNSPDGTGRAADELASRHERVSVLHRPGKLGLGKAYAAGFAWGLARPFDLFVEMDADLSHPPKMLPVFLEHSRHAGVVVGSRYVGGHVRVVDWPATRLAISIFGSWYARTITRLPVKDATGGFNAFRRAVLESVDLERIESTGYSFQIELKLRAWRAGAELREVPFVFTERVSGDSKMSQRILWEAAWRVWKLRLLDLAGRL